MRRDFFFTADRLAGWLLATQQTKQMSSFSREGGKKTLLRTLLFRLQTKQTPVHNNEPADHRQINTRHDINVARVAICPRVVSFTGVSLREENPAKSASSAARRSLTPCFQNSVVSRQNSRGWEQASSVVC